MSRRRFFTPEMGKYLRNIRVRAHLTQLEVADRMDLTGHRRETQIWRLEQGKTVNPTLERVALFLQACGASWSDFIPALEHVETHEVRAQAIDNSGLARADRERLARATGNQVRKFEQGLRFSAGAKPLHPSRRAAVAGRLRNYRITANLIEQAVEEILKPTELLPASYALYKAVARHCLGFLWRDAQRPAPRRKQPSREERLTRRLEAKEADWRRQKLDLALVKQVQEVVIERFERLQRENPELLSGPVGGGD
jgi:transcriptional regulator with XRE-family HTH domain